MAPNSGRNGASNREDDEGSPDGFLTAVVSWVRRARQPIELFTLVLGVVALLQWCTFLKTDETLRLAQRAWLVPVDARLTSPVKEGEGLRFHVHYINTGREPAIDIHARVISDSIAGFAIPEANMDYVSTPPNKTCDSL